MVDPPWLITVKQFGNEYTRYVRYLSASEFLWEFFFSVRAFWRNPLSYSLHMETHFPTADVSLTVIATSPKPQEVFAEYFQYENIIGTLWK